MNLSRFVYLFLRILLDLFIVGCCCFFFPDVLLLHNVVVSAEVGLPAEYSSSQAGRKSVNGQNE